MRISFALAVFTLAALLCAAGAQSSDPVRYRTSRPLNYGQHGDFCYCNPIPWDLNEVGDIAGLNRGHDADDLSLIHDGETGETFFFPHPGYAAGVNENGAFAGQVRGWQYTPSRAYFRSADGQILIGESMPEVEVYPAAINDVNLIVGRMGEWNAYQAFRWDPLTDALMLLGDLPEGTGNVFALDINNAGLIVGQSRTGRGGNPEAYEAFVWTESNGMQRMPEIEGGYAERANVITERGQILGWAWLDHYGASAPFIWDSVDGYVDLHPAFIYFSSYSVADLNIHRQVVGAGRIAGSQVRAFVWNQTNGLRFLQQLIDPCETSPPEIVFAGAINDQGIIATNCECDPGWFDYVMLLTPYLLGDLDENRQVDMDDLISLLSHFGRSGDATFAQGDMDCDEDVDLQDLTVLLASFGQSLP